VLLAVVMELSILVEILHLLIQAVVVEVADTKQ
jgi:hypothetical protein